jgi:TPP-dependent pyruvate/acetoin dehydrogenase alpha subunit
MEIELAREQLLDAYRYMRLIREFEERIHLEFATGEIPGFVHLYAGEEASAVGRVHEPRRAGLHREHASRPRPLHRQGM